MTKALRSGQYLFHGTETYYLLDACYKKLGAANHAADGDVVEFGSSRGNDDLSGKVAGLMRMKILNRFSVL
jgi:hypothetical protein